MAGNLLCRDTALHAPAVLPSLPPAFCCTTGLPPPGLARLTALLTLILPRRTCGSLPCTLTNLVTLHMSGPGNSLVLDWGWLSSFSKLRSLRLQVGGRGERGGGQKRGRATGAAGSSWPWQARCCCWCGVLLPVRAAAGSGLPSRLGMQRRHARSGGAPPCCSLSCPAVGRAAGSPQRCVWPAPDPAGVDGQHAGGRAHGAVPEDPAGTRPAGGSALSPALRCAASVQRSASASYT